MRPKEVRDKINKNHGFLLKRLNFQLQLLSYRYAFKGKYHRRKIGIMRRKRAIKWIMEQDRLINLNEIHKKFKIAV